MLKRILFAAAVLILIGIVSLTDGISSGKEFVVDNSGGYFEYDDVTLEVRKDFTPKEIKLTVSSFTPQTNTIPFNSDNNKVYEFSFENLDEIKDGFRIFLPKTSNLETPVGFVGIYEANDVADSYAYYPIVGEVAEDEYFLFEIPAAALKGSRSPMTAKATEAYAAGGSWGNYVMRWFMPGNSGVDATENFRIFYTYRINKSARAAAAAELEDKFKLYSKMGYNLHEQKTMDRLNVYLDMITWSGEIDGMVVGKKLGEYELYKVILIDGTKSLKTIRDTATHELFHVAQLPYKLPLWLEEATATYMERYSSTYQDYPVESKEYYDLLVYEGFNKTKTKEIKESFFGYARSTYFKYLIGILKPKNDGVFLRKLFERVADRDVKFDMFEDLIGGKANWITDYYVNLLGERIYPFKDMGKVLSYNKKDKNDYSLNPASLVGKTLSFKNLKQLTPGIIKLNFQDLASVVDDNVGFYYKDLVGQNHVDLIMAVSEADSKNNTHGMVLSKKLGKSNKIFLPKKYLTKRCYSVYVVAINKSNQDINNYKFSLATDLLDSDIFENIKNMDVRVSYTARGSDAALKAYKASHAKGRLSAKQRRDKWNANTRYKDITTALFYNGKTFRGKCQVRYNKKSGLVKFLFAPTIHEVRNQNRRAMDVGFLTKSELAVVAADVYEDKLVIQEVKTKDYKQYGKASMEKTKDGRVILDLKITREIYEEGVQEGSIDMNINLVSR